MQRVIDPPLNRGPIFPPIVTCSRSAGRGAPEPAAGAGAVSRRQVGLAVAFRCSSVHKVHEDGGCRQVDSQAVTLAGSQHGMVHCRANCLCLASLLVAAGCHDGSAAGLYCGEPLTPTKGTLASPGSLITAIYRGCLLCDAFHACLLGACAHALHLSRQANRTQCRLAAASAQPTVFPLSLRERLVPAFLEQSLHALHVSRRLCPSPSALSPVHPGCGCACNLALCPDLELLGC